MMKWILIIPLIFLAFLSFSQNGKHKILIQTNKEVYQMGETIKIGLSSKKPFRLMTDGTCSSSIMPPSYIKEVNGEWKELEARRQMCCGLPYSSPIKEISYEIVIEVVGRYKVVVFTYGEPSISHVIEVENN